MEGGGEGSAEAVIEGDSEGKASLSLPPLSLSLPPLSHTLSLSPSLPLCPLSTPGPSLRASRAG
jgi:hypothetical protein